MDLRLGFGCMRLPMRVEGGTSSVDMAALERMVDIFIGRGFGYFDVASTYCDGLCEQAIRAALVGRYPRESYILADKLPTLHITAAEQQRRIFDSQLRSCGVDCFDRYIVHCATEAFYDNARRFGSFAFVEQMKREGRVRRSGFSYHDSPELLDRILSEHPETDFVQLQINYVDWEHTPIRARECLETARRHGKPVTVMCTLKGGLLASVPASADRRFRALRPDDDASVWALRYAAGLEGVETVLSGMSSVADMERNCAAMQNFSKLGDEELAAVAAAANDICAAMPVQCTSCGYCLAACPAGIDIPERLHLCNDYAQRYPTEAAAATESAECMACGSCERVCPQHIAVSRWIRSVARYGEAVSRA